MNKSQASLIFIFITATLDMIGIGLIIPSLPDVVRRFASDPAVVSEYFGYFIAVYALMQFIASPLLGALSDLYGRRPILLVSLFMAALDYLLMAYAPSLTILFIGRIISGLTGASITVAMAYIADISNDENRSKNYGMVGAAMGLGFIIGPAIGGLVGRYGSEMPFLLAAGMNMLNFLFGIFFLPESFPKEKRRPFQMKKINPLASLSLIFRSPAIIILSLVHFLFQFAGHTNAAIWTLYAQYRYQWSVTEIGISLATVGVLVAISQGLLTRIIVPKLGEYRTIVLCLLGESIAFAAYGFATTGLAIYIILVVNSILWVGPPALQSLVTKNIAPEDQGEFQGSLVSLTSLAAIINPIIVTQIFAYFTHKDHFHLPGAPYFFAAIICFAAWMAMLRYKKYSYAEV